MKTAAGVRQIPLSEAAVNLIVDWRARVKRTEPESLMFATWSGKPISPNNVLRRWIVPACETLGLKRVSWLTLRRTYSSWAHEKGVPGKVIAQLMGHAKVDTTLNVYTQVIDGSLRRAADTRRSPQVTETQRGLLPFAHCPLPCPLEWLLGLDSNQQPSG
jgi:integrase